MQTLITHRDGGCLEIAFLACVFPYRVITALQMLCNHVMWRLYRCVQRWSVGVKMFACPTAAFSPGVKGFMTDWCQLSSNIVPSEEINLICLWRRFICHLHTPPPPPIHFHAHFPCSPWNVTVIILPSVSTVSLQMIVFHVSTCARPTLTAVNGWRRCSRSGFPHRKVSLHQSLFVPELYCISAHRSILSFRSHTCLFYPVYRISSEPSEER